MSSGSSVEDQPLSIEGDEGFIGDYYQHLAEEDARTYPRDVLVGRADSHRHVASVRQPGQANISILDEEDSSVVFVVTDDMPFLVDSVNAELVRQHAAIKLVIHPLFVATRNRESGELVKVNRVPAHLGISSGDTAAMPNLSHLIAQGENASHMESWIAVEINRVTDEAKAALLEGLERVL
ncbi:MAG: NAD-glutamate dehydrogenase, partial [Actinomycetes bacterium]